MYSLNSKHRNRHQGHRNRSTLSRFEGHKSTTCYGSGHFEFPILGGNCWNAVVVPPFFKSAYPKKTLYKRPSFFPEVHTLVKYMSHTRRTSPNLRQTTDKLFNSKCRLQHQQEFGRQPNNSGFQRLVLRITDIYQLNIVQIYGPSSLPLTQIKKRSTATTPLIRSRKSKRITQLRWRTSMKKLEDKQIHEKWQQDMFAWPSEMKDEKP